MKKIIIPIFSLLILIWGCDMLDLNNKIDDPNNLSEENADITYLLNSAQLDLINFTAGRYADNQQGVSVSAMMACRMLHQFGAYTGGFSDQRSTSLNDLWEWAFMGIFKNCDHVLEKASLLEGYNYHTAIAKVLKAYTMVTLVDFFGDVPYSQALQGNDDFKPSADPGSDIYNSAFDLLDDAIADFNSGTPVLYPRDIFYNNNSTRWIKLINTLKLKMWLNLRLTDPSRALNEINNIIASGNYITSSVDDFQFNFAAINANPDSRHPEFINEYDADGSDDYYMSNYFIWLLKESKINDDPRLRYYIYRQTSAAPSGENLPCADNTYDYCYLGQGYWGRDHGDDEGVPNDATRRSVWGVYPIGGAFDNNNYTSVINNQGARGAGILPLMLSSWVNFMLAESSITIGTTGNTLTYLNDGVSQSIQKVILFGAAQASGSPYALTMSSPEVTNYQTEVTNLFNAASTNNDKLNVIATEYFIALYGNGMELYNLYRRTGMPLTIQSPVVEIGQFPRSYQYPQDVIDRNDNFEQKLVTEPVFWDNRSTVLD
jgi:hypothetical protein